ncbi:MAG TPA: CBS domain-containing protein [Burkholderiaceae bacterium]|jgi:CBS domain-containing protein
MQQVSEIMTRNVRAVSPQESLQHAAQLMDEMNVGSLPVCENEQLIGMVTDRDITVRATAAGKSPQETHVQDVMSTDARFCFEDQSIDEVMQQMGNSQIRRVPVVSHDDQHKLIGIVSLGDLATKTSSNRQQEAGQAIEQISTPSRPNDPQQNTQQGSSAASGDRDRIDMNPGPDLNAAAEAGAVGGTHGGTASAGAGVGNLGRVGDATDTAIAKNAAGNVAGVGGSASPGSDTDFSVSTGNYAHPRDPGGMAVSGSSDMNSAESAGDIGQDSPLGHQPTQANANAARDGATASAPGSSIPRPAATTSVSGAAQSGVAATGGGADTAGNAASRPGTSTGNAAGAGVTGGAGAPGGITASSLIDNADVSAVGRADEARNAGTPRGPASGSGIASDTSGMRKI